LQRVVGTNWFNRALVDIPLKVIYDQIDMEVIEYVISSDIMNFAKQDIEALANFLGDKKFMMGNQVSSLDAIAFAFLCMIYMGGESTEFLIDLRFEIRKKNGANYEKYFY
jgi:hypothetical protein